MLAIVLTTERINKVRLLQISSEGFRISMVYSKILIISWMRTDRRGKACDLTAPIRVEMHRYIVPSSFKSSGQGVFKDFRVSYSVAV